ncbi:hypothetical protein L596_014336 [Steinernema carpocapsae]|uniref:Uncharacterized protein n=1 Tax=Steinernema carpocapsae TaxID=34508 RepID=A0A4U5NCF9_STECR|nr:hypothetical protein L596_014336 [Steinernema carpocapsae]
MSGKRMVDTCPFPDIALTPKHFTPKFSIQTRLITSTCVAEGEQPQEHCGRTTLMLKTWSFREPGLDQNLVIYGTRFGSK